MLKEGDEMELLPVDGMMLVLGLFMALGIPTYFVLKGAYEFFQYFFGMEVDAIQKHDEGDRT
jgi:hypothetical protein